MKLLQADAIYNETASVSDLSAAIRYYESAEQGYIELALYKDCMTRLSDCQTKQANMETVLAERKAQLDKDAAEREGQVSSLHLGLPVMAMVHPHSPWNIPSMKRAS